MCYVCLAWLGRLVLLQQMECTIRKKHRWTCWRKWTFSMMRTTSSLSAGKAGRGTEKRKLHHAWPQRCGLVEDTARKSWKREEIVLEIALITCLSLLKKRFQGKRIDTRRDLESLEPYFQPAVGMVGQLDQDGNVGWYLFTNKVVTKFMKEAIVEFAQVRSVLDDWIGDCSYFELYLTRRSWKPDAQLWVAVDTNMTALSPWNWQWIGTWWAGNPMFLSSWMGTAGLYGVSRVVLL